MSEPVDHHAFTGAHPTARDFQNQLQAWGFTRRGEDGVHLVYRARGGGRIKLLRSLAGRADADLVAKAARYAGVTVEQFWAGPDSIPDTSTTPPATSSRRRRATARRDSAPALVLAVHTKADRPLGFDEVVDLCGGRVTRDQVRAASATLCRDRHLDRIRSGVYQWAAGTRATRIPTPSPATELHYLPAPAPVVADAPPPSSDTAATELFVQLFPTGVRMTPELFADFERWTRLTEKLTNQADAS